MKDFFTQLFEDVNMQLKSLISNDNCIMHEGQIIEVLCNALDKLRQYVRENSFISLEEEIYFFKVLKPKLSWQLIYYTEVRCIKSKRPPCENKEMITRFYRDEMERVNNYFRDNLFLFQYMNLGSTHLDEIFFTRGKLLTVQPNELLCDLDASFTCFFDSKVARLIAYKKLLVYLQGEQDELEHPEIMQIRKLEWQGSKRQLVEIIYALYANGSIKATLRELADWIESSFNLDLGDFYHAYLELKTRKSIRAEFLDELRRALLKKMDEEEE